MVEQPQSGDVSWLDWFPGEISLKVAPGVSIQSVVSDHGGSEADIRPAFSGPFDESQLEVGLDTWFRVSVVPGTEKPKVSEYNSDPRVEWVELVSPPDSLKLF